MISRNLPRLIAREQLGLSLRPAHPRNRRRRVLARAFILWPVLEAPAGFATFAAIRRASSRCASLQKGRAYAGCTQGAARYYFNSLVSPAEWSILGCMGDGRTVSSPVLSGDIWRVRIMWPNGKKNYFGKFSSEKDAIEWIDAHSWLTNSATENSVSEPPGADRPPPPDSEAWKEVSIEFEGRILTGLYGKYNGMLTVRSAQGTKTKRAGRLPDRVLARMMLRELATEEKYRARG